MGHARVVDRLVPAAAEEEIRPTERIFGVDAGDRLDVIALKQDAALTKANNRIVNCAAFWAKIKASREETPLKIPVAEK